MDTEGSHPLFHVGNSLTLSKRLLYLSTTPNGELEGMLAFLVPPSQCTAALNDVHHDTGHQGQQQTLALAQECFWWPMMVEDCKTLVWSFPRCHMFEGVIPKTPLCSIRAHAPLELVHVDFTSVESTMELNKLDHLTCYALAVVTRQTDSENLG